MFAWVERAAHGKDLIPNADLGETGGVCEQGRRETHPGVLFCLKPVNKKTQKASRTHARPELMIKLKIGNFAWRRETFNENASV